MESIQQSLSEVEIINKKLLDAYGYAIDENKAKFRIVWSTDQRENRFGEFIERTEGGVFLREVKGIQEVQKYPWDKDRWILEHLVYLNPNGVIARELVESRGWSYEWLYTFQGPNKEFLPLNEDVAFIRIHFFINRNKSNKGVLEEWFENKEKKKRDRLADIIGEYLRSPYFGDLVG